MANSSDQLPPLHAAAEYCNAVGLTMSKMAMLDYREPAIEIAAYDTTHGDTDIPDPLLSAHRLGRSYLQCGGDFVYSIGKLLEQEVPMVMSPAVLTRAAAEYASRSWYISDPQDTPEGRVAKMARLFDASLAQYGFIRPDAPVEERQLYSRLRRWSSRQRVAKVAKPHIDKLIVAMMSEAGKQEYDWLSGHAHASAITITVARMNAEADHPQRKSDSWRHALYAGYLGTMAASRVCELRQGDSSDLQHLYVLHDHYASVYESAVRSL